MAPIDCTIDFDSSNIAGKTAIVTGGASGIGEAYVRALVHAKVYVIIGDLNHNAGRLLESSLSNVKFVQVDVTNWDDQVQLFEEAASFSPSGKVHYVVANAGLARQDDVFKFDGDGQKPKKPNLKVVDVNLYGVLYTAKLAFHYFVKQNGTVPSDTQEDTCLVLIGSGAAFLDCPRGPQYSSTKWAQRGIMHSLRRTAYYYGSRVNVISPWYVRTSIIPQETFDKVAKSGVVLAEASHAGEALLRLLSDRSINGRSLFISGKKWAPSGYMDLDIDDYAGNELIQEIQADQIVTTPPEAGLFVG